MVLGPCVPILRVVPNGPLSDAGLADTGLDININMIISVDGMRVTEANQVMAIIDTKRPDDILAMEIMNADSEERKLLQVKLGSLESVERMEKGGKYIKGRDAADFQVFAVDKDSDSISANENGELIIDESAGDADDVKDQFYDVLI